MKIQRLQIKNIASIENAEIVFDQGPLAQDPIFLISGDTGTGKSTILNAICLALYNEVPALNDNGTKDNDREGIGVNNPRQMMRRGTGSAEVVLYFMGNDDKPYKVEWALQRAHKKIEGKMQDVKRAITRLDQNVTETGDKKVKDRIVKAAGLTFEQFTRMTMLAQGQFAAFMKAKEADKSDILEKLTGTDIYAAIGKEIFAQKSEREKVKMQLEAEIKGANLLTAEQRDELQEQSVKAEALAKEKGQLAAEIGKQLQWLKGQLNLNQQLKNKQDQLTIAENNLAQRYARVAAGKTWIEGQAEAERKIINEIESAASQRFEGLAPESEAARLGATLVQAQTAQQEAQKSLDAKEEEKKKVDIEGATHALKSVVDAISHAQNAILAVKNQRMLQEAYDNAANVKAAKEKELIEEKAKQAEEKTKLAEAQKAYEKASAIWEGQKELSHHLDSIREHFEGEEVCPLCGSQDVHFHAAQIIDEALAKAKQKVEETKSAYNEIQASLSRKEVYVKELTRYINAAQKEMDSKRKPLDKAKKEAETLSVDAANPQMLDILNAKMAELDLQKQDKQKALDYASTIIKQYDQARQALDKAKEKVTKAQEAITQSIDRHRKALENIERKVEECNLALEPFADKYPEATELPEYEAKAIGSRISVELAEFGKAIAARNTAHDQIAVLKEQAENHQTQKPEIPEETSIEELTESKKAVEAAKDEALKERTAAITRLTDDAKKAEALRRKESQLATLAKEVQDWSLLNDLFGGADGKKFRNIAQSYVLRVLLGKANYYLEMLSPRYSLDCEDGSLSINVIDNFQGGAVRNVGLLSGGEGFIVSLALALGLSAISKERLNVDTLFIDEGFGTLDRSTLETVITTLDRLHQIGGRRIGIISHVEALKERIPTQIQLHRTGPSSSEVRIVTL